MSVESNSEELVNPESSTVASSAEILDKNPNENSNESSLLTGGELTSPDTTAANTDTPVQPEESAVKSEEENQEETGETEEAGGEEGREDINLEGGARKDQVENEQPVLPAEDLKIQYILPEDEELINPDRVIKQVHRYIDNYRSEEYKTYKKNFNTLYQKYSNKNYIIETRGDFITVIKSSKTTGKDKKDRKDGKDGKEDKPSGEIVMELKKPKYIWLNGLGYFDNMKREIGNQRAELQFKYQQLVNKFDVRIEDKTAFEKERKKFIENLETYYIQTSYYTRINGIDINNKVDIILQEPLEYRNDNLDTKDILEGQIYKIDKNLINDINTENSNKLNHYNELIAKINASKDIKNNKKLIEDIKNYLDRSKITELDKNIKNNAKQQSQYINYIIANIL